MAKPPQDRIAESPPLASIDAYGDAGEAEHAGVASHNAWGSWNSDRADPDPLVSLTGAVDAAGVGAEEPRGSPHRLTA